MKRIKINFQKTFFKNDRGVDHRGEGGVGMRMCIARRHPNSTVSLGERDKEGKNVNLKCRSVLLTQEVFERL